MRIGVVGAGMAGLVCARALVEAGLDVSLFDKSRGVGGRIATRRTENGGFDHGAFAFAAVHPGFRSAVEEWIEEGHVARWEVPFARVDARGRWEDHLPADALFVGSPTMNAPARALARHLPFERGFRVVELRREDARTRLVAEDGRVSEPLDHVVLALPAPQVRELLPEKLAASIAHVAMTASWAVCVRYSRALELPFGAAWFESDELASMARSRFRPGRGPEEWVVLHGTGTWSEPRILGSAEEAQELLLAAWRKHLPVAEPPVAEVVAHRWRYALTSRPLGAASIHDREAALGVCGDWCLGAGLEAAYLSGIDLAQRISGR